jgi:hypothetical protein
MYEISAQVAQVMHSLGRGTSVPTRFSERDMLKYFPKGTSLGTNARCKAERSRGAGWEPKYETRDMLESIRAEVEAELK